MVRVIIADSALDTAPRSPFRNGFLSTLGQVEGNCGGGMAMGPGAITQMVRTVAKVWSQFRP